MTSKREAHRARYIEGWNSLDLELLLASVTEDFRFEDPADPAPITKAMLADYLMVWPTKAAALGGRFEFHMTDRMVQDSGGLLLEYYCWRLSGTDVEGMTLVRTSDQGVQWERLSYFRTPWPLRA